MTPDIHAAAGAYALDALDGDERNEFESHLAHCAACRAEVVEFRDTAALLGAVAAEPAPPAMRAAVLARIDRTRQDGPLGGAVARAQTRWWRPILPAAAAASVVALLGLSFGLVRMSGRVRDLDTQVQAVTAVLAAPDARTVAMDGSAGHATAVVSEARDLGVFVADDLVALDPDEVYALWAIHDDGAVLIDAVHPDRAGEITEIIDGDVAGAVALGVTIEAANRELDVPHGDLVLEASLV